MVTAAGSEPVSFSWRDRLGLLAAALSGMAVQLDWLAVDLALDRIAHDFAQSDTDLEWVLTGFMLAFVGLLPVAGWLADAHGRPRTVIQGTAVFLVGSIGCALAPDAAWLVVGRVLPGAGGALVAPGSDATIAGVFHGRCKSVAFGFVMGAAGAGAALRPVVEASSRSSVGATSSSSTYRSASSRSP
ncbi:MFS transporter [Streptomyces vinaceus]|uniref:MFS transporter n=1 Tax=Streptomyces vinaceus TaxID=1960 RepID=UPI00368F443A